MEKQTLEFNVGLTDGASGPGAGFSARVNGETLWSRTLKESRWEAGTADLSRWQGQAVLIQLITETQGDRPETGARWADVAIK